MRRRHLAAALGLGAVVAFAFVALDRSSPNTVPTQTASPTTSGTCAAPAATATTTPTTPSATGPTTPATATARPPTTAPPTAVPQATVPALAEVDLGAGATGADVAALQQRLAQLNYGTGSVTGSFDDETLHAVIALQKSAGLNPSGVADEPTRRAANDSVQPAPHSSAGLVVEVDIERQVLLLVRDGRLRAAFDTSTGRPGLETPIGVHEIYLAVDTADYGGGEYRPIFFEATRALAIHGYATVPTYPYSHGCARVTYASMDFLWSAGVSVGTQVLVY